MKHFIACVQGKAKTRSDVEVGQRATTVGLLGNIAYRTGLKLQRTATASSSMERRRPRSCCGVSRGSLGIWCRNRKPGYPFNRGSDAMAGNGIRLVIRRLAAPGGIRPNRHS